MSNESKRTQGSPGDFEDKINAAMADLELDEDDDFHDADFYDEKADAPFDSLDQDDQDEENPDEEAEEEEEEVLIPDMSDPNKMMTPDEIAALIANL